MFVEFVSFNRIAFELGRKSGILLVTPFRGRVFAADKQARTDRLAVITLIWDAKKHSVGFTSL